MLMTRAEMGGRSPPAGQGRQEEQQAAPEPSVAPRQSASGSADVRRRPGRGLIVAGLVLSAVAAAALARPWWQPPLQAWLEAKQPAAEEGQEGEHEHAGEHAHEGEHNHAHQARSEGETAPRTPASHDQATTIELSPQAQRNVGLSLITVEPRDFQRTVSVPATIVQRPGRSQITVSAPLTGIVTRIYPIPGQAVRPGEPLFELRLTHEDLVEKQTAFLRDLEQLDVAKQELARLEDVTRSGALPGKMLLEQGYERQKLEGAMRAEREALLLHGLSDEQIQTIEKQRRLIRKLVIATPEPDSDHASGAHQDFLQVARLAINRGDHVNTGTPLAILSDHCELYIEGSAFEQDAQVLNRVANAGTEVSALVESEATGKREVSGLRILYVEDQVERDSRALKFYAGLANELVRNEATPDGRRFISWRYKPGQRVEVLVPVERWERRVVLPVQAVVQEGAESFVFLKHGDHFDRQAVHVEYRDQQWAVLGADGALAPGQQAVANGAYQIHLAVKNKTGGGADPHAGHNH